MLADRHQQGGAADTTREWRILREAASLATVDAALRDLYVRLDAAVAARGPICWQSGKCCRFDSYGHRLYVTALEIAWFLHHVPPSPPPDIPPPETRSPSVVPLYVVSPEPFAQQDACIYQVNGLCSRHTMRPLGCRVFFCQRGTESWQHELYERFMAELRDLHDCHGLPYRYLEWRAGLQEGRQALADGGAPG